MSAVIDTPDDGAFVVFRPELHVDPALIERGEHEGKVYHFVSSGVVAQMGGSTEHVYVSFKLDDKTLGSMRIPWSAIRAVLAARPDGRR